LVKLLGLRLLPLFILFLNFCFQAFAAERSVVRLHMRHAQSMVSNQALDKIITLGSVKIAPIVATLRVRHLGNIRIRLSAEWLKSWPAFFTDAAGKKLPDTAAARHFRGTFHKLGQKGKDTPLALSLLKLNSSPNILMLFEDNFKFEAAQKRSYRVEIPFRPQVKSLFIGKAKFSNARALSKRSCETEPGEGSPDNISFVPQIRIDPGTPSQIREVELGTEADFEYFNLMGADANSEIAAIVNASNTIYGAQLGISFKISYQNIYTSSNQPYNSSFADELLDQFANFGNADPNLPWADAYHLFSGKTLDQYVLGISFIGSVCRDLGSRYSLSQSFDGIHDYLIFSHELGHSLGATHDDVSGPSIMNAALNTEAQYFSSFSVAQISNFTSRYRGCLGVDGPPNLALRLSRARKAVNKKSSILTLVLVSNQGWKMSKPVELYYRRNPSENFTLISRFPLNTNGKQVSTAFAGEYMAKIAGLETGSEVIKINGRIPSKKTKILVK